MYGSSLAMAHYRYMHVPTLPEGQEDDGLDREKF